jgi:hypothetical protein
MSHESGGFFTQNRINIRLVQNNVHFDKAVWGSDLQLLLQPTARGGIFDPEDLPAGTPHHMTIFALCFSQTCHVLNLPIRVASRHLAVASPFSLAVIATLGCTVAPPYT